MTPSTVPWSSDHATWDAVSAERGVRLRWPGDLVPLEALPLLYIEVTTPEDQSGLHHHLAQLGYVPELMAHHEGHDFWRFHHPDGEPPT